MHYIYMYNPRSVSSPETASRGATFHKKKKTKKHSKRPKMLLAPKKGQDFQVEPSANVFHAAALVVAFRGVTGVSDLKH